MEEFQQKLRAKTPIGKLGQLMSQIFCEFSINFYIDLFLFLELQTDQGDGKHPYQEKEPLKAWPNDINPHTGEIGWI